MKNVAFGRISVKAIKTERCVGKIKKEDVIWKLKMEGLIVGTFCIIGLIQIIISFLATMSHDLTRTVDEVPGIVGKALNFFILLVGLSIVGMLVWSSTYQIIIRKKKEALVGLLLIVVFIGVFSFAKLELLDHSIGSYVIIYVLLVCLLQYLYSKNCFYVCRYYEIVRYFPAVLLELGVLLGLLIIIIAFALIAVIPLGIVAVIGGIWFVRKKQKEFSDRLRETKEEMTIIVGLHDFYTSAPFSKVIPMNDINKEISRKNNIYLLQDCYKYDDLWKKGRVIFYYKPYYLLSIAEEDRVTVIANVINWLAALKNVEKEVVVLCDQKGYEQKKEENWDEFTQLLFENQVPLHFGNIKNREEWLELEFSTRRLHFGIHTLDIPNISKYRYIIKQIEACNEASDNVQKFYGIIKIVEYIFQYRGLYTASTQSQKIRSEELSFSMGGWNELQKLLGDTSGRKYDEPDILQAVICIDKALLHKTSGKKKYNYYEICDLLVQLRNKYIGHGTMAYSVSQELLDAVYYMAFCVMEVFVQDEVLLRERREQIDQCFCKNKRVDCILQRDNKEYLLSYFDIVDDKVVADYIDFVSGEIVVEGERRKYKLQLNQEVGKDE